MYILAEKELIKFWKYITTALVCFECVRVGHYTRTVLTSTQNASTVFGHWQLQRQVTVFFVCCVQICLLTYFCLTEIWYILCIMDLQRLRGLLVVPRYRLSSYGRRAFSVAGPAIWNWLPGSLRDPAISRESFKRSLKTFLFLPY